MAKNYASITNTISQVVGKYNDLVDKVGDLALLNTLADSSLVDAINSILDAGGVDSAAIVQLLDSGQYISIIDLGVADSGRDIVTRGGSQTITGTKTFSSVQTFTENPVIRKTSAPQLSIRSTDRRDSSEVLGIVHASTGSTIRWQDSDGSPAFNIIVVSNRSASSPQPGKIDFYSGNNTLVGTLDSASAATVSTTIMTRAKNDSRYIQNGAGTVLTTNLADGSVTTVKLDDSAVTVAKVANDAITTAKLASNAVTTAKILDDAVTRAKLANEVQLIIYDSAGNAIKTLYGAGS